MCVLTTTRLEHLNMIECTVQRLLNELQIFSSVVLHNVHTFSCSSSDRVNDVFTRLRNTVSDDYSLSKVIYETNMIIVWSYRVT